MRARLAVAAVLGWFSAWAAALAAVGAVWARDDVHPPQPVAYDHRLHVEQHRLECAHCHRYPERGPAATLPAMSVCGECHAQMASDNPAVRELQRYLALGQPVPWLKVHSQPWHVYFTHEAHLARQIGCEQCHGEVRLLGTGRRLRSLEMGWCLGCHRRPGANGEPWASDDCLTCHR